MRISRKLLLGYLAFGIPMLVLLILLDGGFAQTGMLAEREADGIEYAERVHAVQQAISRYQIELMTAMIKQDADHGPMVSGAIVDAALAELTRFHDQIDETLEIDAGEMGLGASFHPDSIRSAWIEHQAAPSRERFSGLIDQLTRIGTYVLDQSGATQDPDLNIAVLVRSVMVNVPQYSFVLSDAIGFPDDGEALRAYKSLLEYLADAQITSLLWLAIEADEEGQLVTVRTSLGTFLSAHEELTSLLETDAEYEQALIAALGVFEGGLDLYRAGSETVGSLVSQRRRLIVVWRIAAVSATSVVYVLFAALLLWIRRSISQSLDGVVDYTRRVADGDYGAQLRVEVSEELAELYDHTRVMVGEVMQLAEFPRQNPGGVVAVELDGDIRYANPAAQRVAEEHSATVADLLPQHHRDVVRRLASGQTVDHSYESQFDGRWFEWTYHSVSESELVHLYFRDITERKKAEQQILHDAFHDSLTGLPNRALLLDRLGQALALSAREESPGYALMLLDLDRFKVINDSLGHERGDELLRAVADRITTAVQSSGTVARLGGDEFGILLSAVRDSRSAVGVAERIHAAIGEPLQLPETRLSLTASIGVVLPSDAVGTPTSILRDADTAMYQAKNAGRARTEIFNASMHEDVLAALQTESELAAAIEAGRIEPFYQPIVNLKTGRISGFEALARWIDPDKGVIPPGKFIDLAEESGLIVPLGNTMLTKAVKQACEWRRTIRTDGELIMGINLSVRQFAHEGLVREIGAILESHDVAPDCIKLEVTESGLMSDVETSMRLLQSLKELQVQLGIDDFGTGYSSLSYLHRFPFDILKVDQSFVSRMEDERESQEIVTNIISLAHGLSKDVISEGIETEGQMNAIRSLGSEYGQGYFFSRPVPADEAGHMLEEDPTW